MDFLTFVRVFEGGSNGRDVRFNGARPILDVPQLLQRLVEILQHG